MSDLVCAYCVQWRCAGCKSQDWPDCCEHTTDAEPYWPDGSVATITSDVPCPPCEEMLANWELDRT